MQTYLITNENYAKLADHLSGLVFRQAAEDGKHQRIKFVSMKFQKMILPQIQHVLTAETEKVEA
jgi:hypothetical protein